MFTLGLKSSFMVAKISEHFPPQPSLRALTVTTEAWQRHRELHALSTLYDKRVGSLTSPANHNIDIEDAGDGASGF